MGNQNSGNVALAHPPAKWTQSFPRDPRRLHRYGAIPENKVLPHRIPGQRLRPTENGRNLQVEGTISGRRASEFSVVPNGFSSPMPGPHSSSMTALNVASSSTASMHDLRFGLPPKTYTSEPDLRGSSSQISPSPVIMPHTIISQSPTKGKIKSKKRFKAPNPPNGYINPRMQHVNNNDSPRSENSSNDVVSSRSAHSVIMPASPKSSKGKSKKIGLFKKKNESKKVSYESRVSRISEESPPREIHGDFKVVVAPNDIHVSANSRESRSDNVGASVSVPDHRPSTSQTRMHSPREELRQRAKSLDCIHYELQRSSPTSASSISELHSPTKIISEDINQQVGKNIKIDMVSKRSSTLERNSTKNSKSDKDSHQNYTIERSSRSTSTNNNPGGPKFSSIHNDPIVYSRSIKSRNDEIPDEINKEWEDAEKEINEKKRKNLEMQKEIQNAVKNLRKVSSTEETSYQTADNDANKSNIEYNDNDTSQKRSSPNEDTKDSQPKTFFFGMEPEVSNTSTLVRNSGMAKIKAQEEVKIKGSSVEYSKRSIERSEKRSRSRNRDSSKESHKSSGIQETKLDKRKVSRDIDQFVISLGKLKQSPNNAMEDLASTSHKRDDGGYHSRQNSGSFHLDTEHNSENDSSITMNLRPTLPRRQLEIPRFSPNAAWRSLSQEPTTRHKDKENLNESRSSEDTDPVYEDKIQRYTRPTAPPRGSGEKSADSGISGDAGSPGPIPEFELLTSPGKPRSGPLAVSSPLAPGRDSRRAWTPAQDLDENSLDESAENSGKSSVIPGLSTPPKLTSITNMFSTNDASVNEVPESTSNQINVSHLSEPISQVKCDEISPRKKQSKEPTPQKFNSLRKLKRSMSGRKSPDNSFKEIEKIRSPEDAGVTEDNWRDNWSMSRSIPNSLNTCDEPDCASNVSGRPCRSRSESRTGAADVSMDNGDGTPQSRPRTPSYLQYGSSGHIMYLPEYNSRKVTRNSAYNDSDQRSISSNNKTYKHNLTEKHSKSQADSDNSVNLDGYNYGPTSLPPALASSHKHQSYMAQFKKHKKFSYQSTVRILEKRKLEEKLAKEVAEKEQQRLREAEAMKKVEEEFQRKREKEKRKLKHQSKVQQENIIPKNNSLDVNFLPQTYQQTYMSERPLDIPDYSSRSSSTSPPHNSLTNNSPTSFVQPFQSLPTELMASPSNSPSPNGSSRLFKGFKSWVKSRKEPRNGSHSGGYASDVSCNTLTSAPRQEPDGAPASSPRRKSTGEDFRAEIIAASRQRSGDISPDEEIYSSSNSRRSMSPESRRLTQELPELVQERREYREYRPSKHSHSQPSMVKPHISSALPGNYRREFAFGHSHSISSNLSSMKHKLHEESDRISRHSSEGKRSEGSGRSVNRSSSAELLESMPSSSSPHYQYSSSAIHHPKQSSPTHLDKPLSYNFSRTYSSIDSSPARFAHSLLTPFNSAQNYRPVSFSPPPPTKILHVN